MLTDLYQLTMYNSYVRSGMDKPAVFEFFVRQMPPGRSFFIACGLETVLDYLECLRFTDEEIAYLRKTGRFSERLIEELENFQFTGDVYAMPEGTVFFPDEPIIRVEASIPQAQLVETRIINLLHYQTLIATKAVRCMLAANGRAVLVDFGLRRAHGAEAGLLAARASYIAGFIGTSTVLADFLYGIPIFGTMAHSFIEAHEREEEAFVDFCMANPHNTTLLIDTYDTIKGAKNAVKAAQHLKNLGIRVQRVRLDSGDILKLSKQVRRLLDREGFSDIQIFVSGNMDEFTIKELLDAGAPINGFGVGTKLDTSDDVPYLECAYKLTEYNGLPRMKKSPGKATYPGRKQVYRNCDESGAMRGDILTVYGDEQPGAPLIVPVMRGGKRLRPAPTLKDMAAYTRGQLSSLPDYLRTIDGRTSPYPVKIAPALRKLKITTEAQLEK